MFSLSRAKLNCQIIEGTVGTLLEHILPPVSLKVNFFPSVQNHGQWMILSHVQAEFFQNIFYSKKTQIIITVGGIV